MNIKELIPVPTTKVSFKLSTFKSLPKLGGCYVLSTYDDFILYIGLSSNLYSRFQQHLENPEKTKPTTNGKAIWFYYILCEKHKLEQLERTWLNQFVLKHGVLPILNKIESPIR